MSEEQDGFMLNAFGVDLGQLAQNTVEEGSAMLGQAANTVSQVVHGVQGAVEGAIGEVTGAVSGAVKKVAGAVSGSPGGQASGGGTGSFPLGGSVGRGGRNATNDVRAHCGSNIDKPDILQTMFGSRASCARPVRHATSPARVWSQGEPQ